MQDYIELTHRQPQFWGSVRAVYVHPDDADLLIKIPRSEAIERAANVPSWKKRFKPLGVGSMNMHELRETMRLRPSAQGRIKHLFTTIGMVQTDMGWGLVVKAERDRDGNYAATIASMVMDEARYKKPLEDFMHWLETTRAVFYDLNPWNLVLSYHDGEDEIVAIDGVGEKSAILSRTYFQSINKKKNRKAKERCYRFIGRLKAQEIRS